jgi:hypothetical protein
MELLNPLADGLFPAKTASFTGTAGSTDTWQAGPQGVVIWTTTNAYVKVGEDVTATTADTPIPAGVPIAFKVPNGTGAPWRVSAIQAVAGGTVYAKPINAQ